MSKSLKIPKCQYILPTKPYELLMIVKMLTRYLNKNTVFKIQTILYIHNHFQLIEVPVVEPVKQRV